LINNDYYYFLIFIICSIIISIILFIISNILIIKTQNYEKISSYECGFDPFDTTLIQFDVQFYMVSIIFILFDLEISFLLPWILSIFHVSLIGYISIFIFIFILIVGFAYEIDNEILYW